MATSRITDVVDPEILSDIVLRRISENLFQLPGVVEGVRFTPDTPGTFWEVPFADLLGDFETYDPDTPLTSQKLTQGRFGHVIIRKAALYGVDKIVRLAAIRDPMTYFSDQLTEKILERLMESQIDVFEGAIPTANRRDNDAVISTDEITEAKFTLADKATMLKWITMHSSSFKVLEKAGDIVYQPINNILPLAKPTDKQQVITNDKNLVASVAGLIVKISDKTVIVAGTPNEYASYLTGDRVMSMHNQGSLNIDTDRDITTKEDFISPDFDYILSLWGTNYDNAPTYTDVAVALPGNYTLKWNQKDVHAVRLVTRIA